MLISRETFSFLFFFLVFEYFLEDFFIFILNYKKFYEWYDFITKKERYYEMVYILLFLFEFIEIYFLVLILGIQFFISIVGRGDTILFFWNFFFVSLVTIFLYCLHRHWVFWGKGLIYYNFWVSEGVYYAYFHALIELELNIYEKFSPIYWDLSLLLMSMLKFWGFLPLFIIFPILLLLPLLIAVAYFTLVERKVLGAMHRRKGPNVIGYLGLLQPLSDGFKLFVKESILPSSADLYVFLFSPVFGFICSLLAWGFIPYANVGSWIYSDITMLYVYAISSISVYSIIMSGWSSNSKYAFLGALRSAAQMVSYEVSMGFIIIVIVLCSGSFNLKVIIESQADVWFHIPLFFLSSIFFVSALAETNRHPFDLPEAEAELVSGYNVEYSAMNFALFSLAEYSNMLLMSFLNVILFFGGWLAPIDILFFLPASLWFSLKVCFFVFLFVWIRAVLPRYRYDQLMILGWKSFLPIALTFVLLTAYSLIILNYTPF